jgi:hypothetical protein
MVRGLPTLLFFMLILSVGSLSGLTAVPDAEKLDFSLVYTELPDRPRKPLGGANLRDGRQ